MAVEKMKVMGIIGPKEELNRALRQIILNGSMHIINASTYLNSNDFVLSPSEENVEALEEIPYLKTGTKKRDFSQDERIVNELIKVFNLNKEVRSEYLVGSYDYEDYIQKLRTIYSDVEENVKAIDKKIKMIETYKIYITNLSYFRNYDIEIEKLFGMSYFTFKLMRFSRDSYQKLRKNYENIPAVIIKLDTEKSDVIVLAITPIALKETAERIFASLNYTELKLPKKYKGKSSQIISRINKEINKTEEEISEMRDSLIKIEKDYLEFTKMAFSRLSMEEKVENVKSEIAFGRHLFFMFGFVPVSEVDNLKRALNNELGNSILYVVEDVGEIKEVVTPPTRLSNSRLFRPFETLVKMYGIPSYGEKDPTVFFGLTYMLLFGMMFGDLGQGLIGLLAGLYLEFILKKESFGGILVRLGLSSSVFGVLYGSVFGSEKIIPALVIRPMLNINTMLISSIVLGILFITIGFIYGLINKKAAGNIEEGIFGRNGLVGLAFYWDLLIIALCFISGKTQYVSYQVIALVVLLILMLFKQPIANKIKKSPRLYNEPAGDYYIESSFGVIETLLSMLSNTISFIRVGAFALNHVGLYIAFATMAQMMNSRVGGVIVLIIGNIVIIGLEGLIVFIQALRLEFYELFSKYYEGEGVEYMPVHLKLTHDRYSRKWLRFFKTKDVKSGYSPYTSFTI